MEGANLYDRWPEAWAKIQRHQTKLWRVAHWAAWYVTDKYRCQHCGTGPACRP